jgi:N-carbamoyl-L-amino-acid hydrolase
MMFTQSLAGLSHNKAEDTRIDDLKMAVQAFDRLTKKTVNWLSAQKSKG